MEAECPLNKTTALIAGLPRDKEVFDQVVSAVFSSLMKAEAVGGILLHAGCVYGGCTQVTATGSVLSREITGKSQRQRTDILALGSF